MLQDIKEMHQTRFIFKGIFCRLSKIRLGTEDIILYHVIRFRLAKHGRREGAYRIQWKEKKRNKQEIIANRFLDEFLYQKRSMKKGQMSFFHV